MDYDAMIAFHHDYDADLTMATIRVPLEEASRFGIVEVDSNYRVISFVEKPLQPPSNLANMGVYVFRMDVLDKALWEDHKNPDSSHDFGKDILPKLVREGARVMGFPYSGYWVDVGTTYTYWKAHMDLLNEKPSIDLNDRSWVIHTRTEERPPARIAGGAVIQDSLISDGCVIDKGAIVERSVLSPGVRVHRNAVIRESIVMTDTVVESEATIERAIIDKRVFVGRNARVGSRKSEPLQFAMIGKNSVIPENYLIEPGALIFPDVTALDYPSNHISADTIVENKREPYEP
jgi:glucose-1-phosphate adenylyltransferase